MTTKQEDVTSNLNEYLKEAKDEGFSLNDVSDGYHTFGELYDHRIALWICLCVEWARQVDAPEVWKSKTHSDGSTWEGWFIMGAETMKGQISYHLPLSYWDECDMIPTKEISPEWDGHTSADVLERLRNL